MSETTKTRADAAAAWWRGLQDLRANGEPNPFADRRARAVLRRADPVGALEEESVLALHRRLWGAPSTLRPWQFERTLRVALVLVHVRREDKAREGFAVRSFARALGRQNFDDPVAALSPLRFRRLLAARDVDEIVREFRRAVDVVGNVANVRDLAGVLLGWEEDRVRTRFAFDYFAAGQTVEDVAASGEPAETALTEETS